MRRVRVAPVDLDRLRVCEERLGAGVCIEDECTQIVDVENVVFGDRGGIGCHDTRGLRLRCVCLYECVSLSVDGRAQAVLPSLHSLAPPVIVMIRKL